MKELKERICSVCGKTYLLTEEQKLEIQDAAKHYISKFILKCPICHHMDFVCPAEMLGIEECHQEVELKDCRLFCCPIEACIGFVEEDEEVKGHYSCSECGTEWGNIDAIYKDIEKIVLKYHYRNKVYEKINNVFKSISFDKIPENYYDKVQIEKIE